MIKQFQLFGETIDVIYTDEIKDSGQCFVEKNIIYIKNTNDEDYMNSTFFHELVHMILSKLDEDSLGNDEKFVTKVAGLFHQFIITSKENKKKR